MARPTDYKSEYDELAFKFCLLGATDKQLGDFLGVSEQTINAWKEKHPSFLESMQDGKEKADAEVAKSLYKRAMGMTLKQKKVSAQGFPYETEQELPPDTQAASLWLRNRQPANWRDKQELEHHVLPTKITVISGIEHAPGEKVDE
jgi:hypothetical protein